MGVCEGSCINPFQEVGGPKYPGQPLPLPPIKKRTFPYELASGIRKKSLSEGSIKILFVFYCLSLCPGEIESMDYMDDLKQKQCLRSNLKLSMSHCYFPLLETCICTRKCLYCNILKEFCLYIKKKSLKKVISSAGSRI